MLYGFREDGGEVSSDFGFKDLGCRKQKFGWSLAVKAALIGSQGFKKWGFREYGFGAHVLQGLGQFRGLRGFGFDGC